MSGHGPKVTLRQLADFATSGSRSTPDWLAAVHCYDDLSAVGLTPLLVAAALANAFKPVLSQHSDYIVGATNWEALAQGIATSSIFAFLGRSIGVGSNHRARASRALATASSSVSPAVAQPGNSGKMADHRLDSISCSTRSRNFMSKGYPEKVGVTITGITTVISGRQPTRRGLACERKSSPPIWLASPCKLRRFGSSPTL
jgi:hypothetical protein